VENEIIIMELSLAEDPKFKEHLKYIKGLHNGVQLVFMFPNDYGASVIRHTYSYGSENGLWELAVLDENEDICYDSDLTEDVIGYLTEDNVIEHLELIFKLVKNKVCA